MSESLILKFEGDLSLMKLDMVGMRAWAFRTTATMDLRELEPNSAIIELSE